MRLVRAGAVAVGLAVVLAGCGGPTGVWRDAPVPDGVEAGFVTGPAGEKQREDLCLLLRAWATGFDVGEARCLVRGEGVLVTAPASEESDLKELRDAVPSSTALGIHPVEQTKPGVGSCAPASDVFCDIAGEMVYRVGEQRLTGSDVARADVGQRDGRHHVSVSFTASGRKAMHDLSVELAPSSGTAAIVVAGAVVSAPQFASEIAGDIEISVSARQDAELIAAAFRIGQRPMPLRPGDPG